MNFDLMTSENKQNSCKYLLKWEWVKMAHKFNLIVIVNKYQSNKGISFEDRILNWLLNKNKSSHCCRYFLTLLRFCLLKSIKHIIYLQTEISHAVNKKKKILFFFFFHLLISKYFVEENDFHMGEILITNGFFKKKLDCFNEKLSHSQLKSCDFQYYTIVQFS